MAQHDAIELLKAVPKRAWLVIAAIGAALLMLCLVSVLEQGSGIRGGTTVAGVDIGGQSVPQAQATLARTLAAQGAKPFRIRAAGRMFLLAPGQAGLSLDIPATVSTAQDSSKNPIALLGALSGGKAVDPVVQVNRGQLEGAVQQIASSVDQTTAQPQVIVTARGTVVIHGRSGRTLDTAALEQRLQANLLAPRTVIDAVVSATPPSIGPSAIRAARRYAARAVSAPVIVHAQTISATIPARTIAHALSFAATGSQMQPQLNGTALNAAIAKAMRHITTPGRNAGFVIVNKTPRLVPSAVGRGVSDADLSSAVLAQLGNPAGHRVATVSVGITQPTLTTDQARQLGITQRVSSFTQHFPYAAYRVQNIGRAAKYINGTILRPGQTYSMNTTIRQRTAANGYTTGFVIGPGGVFAEELGGGVSTATTATWTAAFYAGMQRVHTQAHSIYISRYKAGLEATVGWGMFDMQFKNDTPYGVLITTRMTNTSLTVNFWSTRVYSKVEAVFGPQTNIRPFATIFDPSPKCLGQGGVNGFSIKVTRNMYKGSQLVSSEVIPTTYRPAPAVICGLKPPPGCTAYQAPESGKPAVIHCSAAAGGAAAAHAAMSANRAAASGSSAVSGSPSPQPPDGAPSSVAVPTPSPAVTPSAHRRHHRRQTAG